MAEILGVVASGISVAQLAVQFTSSVIKLKTYVNAIKDAPEDIRALVEEIEGFQYLLEEVGHGQAQQVAILGSKSTTRSLSRCERAVECLKVVVEELSVDSDCKDNTKKSLKKKWPLPILWKREKIDKLRISLTVALSMLSTSMQLYNCSLIQAFPNIISTQVVQSMQLRLVESKPEDFLRDNTSGLAGSHDPTETSQKGPHSSPKERKLGHWRAGYAILLGISWDLTLYKCLQGWQFSISTYTVVSFHSPVAEHVKAGNITALQQLFANGKASPFTICMSSDFGHRGPRLSLLDLAASKCDYEVSKFLIEQGADPNYESEKCRSTMEQFANNAGIECQDTNEHSKLARLLTRYAEVTPSALARFRGPLATFSILTEHLDSPMSNLSLESRCVLAASLSERCCTNRPDVFLAALGCSPSQASRVTFEMTTGKIRTLLHTVGASIGDLVDVPEFPDCLAQPRAPPEDYFNHISAWTSVARELINEGANLHALSKIFTYPELSVDLETPLLAIVRGGFRVYRKLGKLRSFHRILNWWISLLHECCIPLVSYAMKEKAIWLEHDVRQEFSDWRSRDRIPKGVLDRAVIMRRRLIGFTFGPTPEQWRFWENEPTDDFAGDFWGMVEKGEEIMPGTWVE